MIYAIKMILDNTYGLLNILEFKCNHFNSLFQAESQFQNSNVGGKQLENLCQCWFWNKFDFSGFTINTQAALFHLTKLSRLCALLPPFCYAVAIALVAITITHSCTLLSSHFSKCLPKWMCHEEFVAKLYYVYCVASKKNYCSILANQLLCKSAQLAKADFPTF